MTSRADLLHPLPRPGRIYGVRHRVAFQTGMFVDAFKNSDYGGPQ